MTSKIEKKPSKNHLTRKKERELINLYQQTKDNSYMIQLIEAHTPYIQKIAYQQFQKSGKIVDMEDLVQEGTIGLIKAIKKFDLNQTSVNPNTNLVVQEQALLTYAHNKILSEMQNLCHRSTAAHIPAHTLRALSFNVKNPGCNTEERKALAKNSMKAESLDFLDTNSESDKFTYRENKILRALIHEGQLDPTFNESTMNVFSPKINKAISKLNPLEWQIFQLKLGLVKNEEFLITRNSVIAKQLNMDIKEVDKIYKTAKRKLAKNIMVDDGSN